MMKLNSPKPAWLIRAGLIVLSIWIVPGCRELVEPTPIDSGSSPSPEVLPSTTPQLVFTPEPTSTEVLVPTPTTAVLERPRYEISAHLDYGNHRVVAEERILISNPAGIVLDRVDLVVPPNNWWGVFSLQDVRIVDLSLEGYSLEGVTLHLDLGGEGWHPDEILEVEILFTLDLPQQNDRPGYGPSPFGYTSLQTNLVDWYPMVPPYQEEIGWLIHEPWIFGEYLVYPAADFEVRLALGTPGLIIAASASPMTEGGSLHYSLSAARNFVFSISDSYQVLERDLDGVKVYGYIFPAYQVPGQAAFEATVQALELYQELYGPYQQASLSMVQADFYHGMEYEGLYFQSKGFFDTYNGSEQSYQVAIAVHETAHQWWFGQIANDQALEPWLDEALCTFSELAFYENEYPESEEWWWGTRVNYYEPEGRIDRSIYGFQEYTAQYLNYRNATYLQGAKFLYQLKTEMGEEAFYSFLGRYAALYKDEIATGEDFFTLLEDYLDLKDLTWIEDYFPEIRQLGQ